MRTNMQHVSAEDKAEQDYIDIKTGKKTANEIRASHGLPPADYPGADSLLAVNPAEAQSGEGVGA